jgi:hypothetical protein
VKATIDSQSREAIFSGNGVCIERNACLSLIARLADYNIRRVPPPPLAVAPCYARTTAALRAASTHSAGSGLT